MGLGTHGVSIVLLFTHSISSRDRNVPRKMKRQNQISRTISLFGY